MKILFIGEIVARPGRSVVKEVLPKILKKHKPDLVLSNAENLAHGRGATEKTVKEMQDVGIEFFSGGDHLFWHRGFDEKIGFLPVIRPANITGNFPGEGYKVLDTKKGKVLLINVMNIQSHKFSEENLSNPFLKVEEILHANPNMDVTLVDFHSEYTSDKNAMAFFLDGRVDAVIGTHTHIPTCDARVLPNGTMFVTDVGMCGNIDSVLGVKKEIIIDRVVYENKHKFEWELEGARAFRSVLIDTTKKEIRRLDEEVI